MAFNAALMTNSVTGPCLPLSDHTVIQFSAAGFITTGKILNVKQGPD